MSEPEETPVAYDPRGTLSGQRSDVGRQASSPLTSLRWPRLAGKGSAIGQA